MVATTSDDQVTEDDKVVTGLTEIGGHGQFGMPPNRDRSSEIPHDNRHRWVGVQRLGRFLEL